MFSSCSPWVMRYADVDRWDVYKRLKCFERLFTTNDGNQVADKEMFLVVFFSFLKIFFTFSSSNAETCTPPLFHWVQWEKLRGWWKFRRGRGVARLTSHVVWPLCRDVTTVQIWMVLWNQRIFKICRPSKTKYPNPTVFTKNSIRVFFIVFVDC